MLNKYLFTVTLIFMATSHFNLIGMFYLCLFIIHSMAYYTFRTYDEPIDIILRDNRRRKNKLDLRWFFAYTQVIVSLFLLALVITGKVQLGNLEEDSDEFTIYGEE